MFALFFSLYMAMFRGSWVNFTLTSIKTLIESTINKIGEFVTSLFNNVETPVTDLGTVLTNGTVAQFVEIPNYFSLVSFVLALITSIGIVVMAVKGVKRAFGIFFMGIRK